MIPRKKRNSSKINLTISIVFHSVLVLVVFVFAAREGLLGKKLKQISVTMIKEKKPEQPKEKPPEPKVEQPKPAEQPKTVAAAPAPPPVAAPPPAAAASDAAVPEATSLPAFDFSDGAHSVNTITSPYDIYKAFIERTLLTRWNRPENVADETFVADVELSVDASGKVERYRWLSGSGDQKWDASVRAALDQTKGFNKAPPKGFPNKFVARFDVESLKSEEVQLGVQ